MREGVVGHRAKCSTPNNRIRYRDTSEYRCLNLAEDGIPCVSALGRTRYLERQFSTPEHVHKDSVEIVFCLRGNNLTFTTDGCEFPFLPGHIFVSRPDEPHHLNAIPKGIFLYWCIFRLPSAGECILGLDLRESRWVVRRFLELPRRHFEGTDAIRRLFGNLFVLHDDESLKPFERRMLMRNAIFNLLLEVATAAEINPVFRSNKRLASIVERMSHDPGQVYSMESIAKETGLSPTSLNAAFKRMTGLPPHAFLLKCRIERAKKELAAGNCQVGALSEKLGFRSYRHFSAQFKAFTGCLPSRWSAECK